MTLVTGSGVDICSFSILSLLFRISEKISTPTSIVLMAINSLVGKYLTDRLGGKKASNPLFKISDIFLYFPNNLCYGYLSLVGNLYFRASLSDSKKSSLKKKQEKLRYNIIWLSNHNFFWVLTVAFRSCPFKTVVFKSSFSTN